MSHMLLCLRNIKPLRRVPTRKQESSVVSEYLSPEPLSAEGAADSIHSSTDREKFDLMLKGSNPDSSSPSSRPRPVSFTA